jgi:hypothetical protein
VSAVVLTARVVPLGCGRVAQPVVVGQAHHIDDRPARHQQLRPGAGELGGEEGQVEPPRMEPGPVAALQQPEGRAGDRADAGPIDEVGAGDVVEGRRRRRDGTAAADWSAVAARADGAGIEAVVGDLHDAVGAPVDAGGLRVEDASRHLRGQVAEGGRHVGGLR